MASSNWKQWVKERLSCARGDVREAFWRFVDHKWKDSLNVKWNRSGGQETSHRGCLKIHNWQSTWLWKLSWLRLKWRRSTTKLREVALPRGTGSWTAVAELVKTPGIHCYVAGSIPAVTPRYSSKEINHPRNIKKKIVNTLGCTGTHPLAVQHIWRYYPEKGTG